MKHHIADIVQTDGSSCEIVVGLCDKHSKELTQTTRANIDHPEGPYHLMIHHDSVEIKWVYGLNRCELCPEDKDKSFIKEDIK